MTRRDHLAFIPAALVLAVFMTYSLAPQPTYTDAFYYINAANRLASGQGLTDPYLWTYIGAPDSLPAPSHLYWMPMASLIAAAGMGILGAPGAYWAAQVPYALLLALLGYTAFWLGATLGGTRRHALSAALIVLFGGFYARFWGMVTTFTPFAVFGACCLIALGRGLQTRHWGWFLLAGMLAGGAHLTRADGLLLVLAGVAAVVWVAWLNPTPKSPPRTQGGDYTPDESPSLLAERGPGGEVTWLAVLILGYLLVMAPWMFRNLNAIGTPLPTGGAQGIWFTEYNDIFNYPPDATPQRLFELGGWPLLLESRWVGLANGASTFIVVEGLVILTPLMLLGLFRRLKRPFLAPFWIYALGLHLAMIVVFPFPGYRGGLFHSSAALFPFWAVLGILGLDDVVDWIAARRRHWNASQAKWLFTFGVVLIAAWLGFNTGVAQRTAQVPPLYTALDATLPSDARLLINDPAQLYYYTGRGGLVLPNESPEVMRELAAQYNVDYLLLERVTEENVALAAPAPLAFIPTDPPAFLSPISLDDPNVRLYAVE